MPILSSPICVSYTHLSHPPSIEAIEALAAEALTTIPEVLRRHCRNVIIRVEDFPDEAAAQEMGLDSPFDLLGLYRGIPLDEKSSTHAVTEPDMIFLYRRPLLDYWCEIEEDLGTLVRHVLIHEIGHHFGFSDQEMHAIESGGGHA